MTIELGRRGYSGRHRLPPPPSSFYWWREWLREVPVMVREIIRKVLVFFLALLTAFVIMLLVLLPFGFIIWQILRYAAGQ
jgi:hypothetical protein